MINFLDLEFANEFIKEFGNDIPKILWDIESESKAVDPFGVGCLHRIYLAQLKNKRKYTASTKTKAEVRGGGRKPWRQKGTGSARAGSKRSPLWVGGGVTFGPKPRTVYKKINKKEKKFALLTSFYLKANQTKFIVDDSDLVNFAKSEKRKTKELISLLNEYEITLKQKTILILSEVSPGLLLASRNLKNIRLIQQDQLSITDMLTAEEVYISPETFALIMNKVPEL
jgi:large subunit ribosomal protein L4